MEVRAQLTLFYLNQVCKAASPGWACFLVYNAKHIMLVWVSQNHEQFIEFFVWLLRLLPLSLDSFIHSFIHTLNKHIEYLLATSKHQLEKTEKQIQHTFSDLKEKTICPVEEIIILSKLNTTMGQHTGFPSVDPWPGKLALTWELVKMKNLWLFFIPTESRTLGLQSSTLYFNKFPVILV